MEVYIYIQTKAVQPMEGIGNGRRRTQKIEESRWFKTERSTAHYAHLTVDPVRASMERAVAAMENAKEMDVIRKIK